MRPNARLALSSTVVLLAIAALAFPAAAVACSVPVFRYALERWHPDPYPAVVFHRGPLGGEDRAAITRLGAAGGSSSDLVANLEPVVVDLDDEPAEEAVAVYESLGSPASGGAALPHVAVITPSGRGPPRVIWHGALRDPASRESLRQLVDSPARRELARRLLAGDAVVWVCLESGLEEKDDAAFGRLAEILAKLEKELKLPAPQVGLESEFADPDSGLRAAGLPLALKFSTLRVSRTDPAERYFVEQLLASEGTGADSLVAEGLKPMVFPVFGRGRVLCAYVDNGIYEGPLPQDAEFLVGPCSCQVKQANPGVDLLMAADWEGAIASLADAAPAAALELPPLGGLDGFAAPPPVRPQGEPEPGAATTGPADSVSTAAVLPSPDADRATGADGDARGSGLARNLALVLVLGVCAVVAGSALYLRKRSSRET
jgi:hypothetical protein